MVGEKVEYNTYPARCDCRATPRAQMMISVQPPPYLEKRKCVSNTNNSTVVSYLHIDKPHIIEKLLELTCATVDQAGAVQYTNQLYFGPRLLVHPLGRWV